MDTPSNGWIPVSDAAKLVGRSPQAVYSWIRQGRLQTRIDDRGRTVVNGSRIIDVEPTVRRGRPVGSASPW